MKLIPKKMYYVLCKCIIMYFINNITAKLLKFENLPSDLETFFIDMNIKSEKYLLCCRYDPNKSHIENHRRHLQK